MAANITFNGAGAQICRFLVELNLVCTALDTAVSQLEEEHQATGRALLIACAFSGGGSRDQVAAITSKNVGGGKVNATFQELIDKDLLEPYHQIGNCAYYRFALYHRYYFFELTQEQYAQAIVETTTRVKTLADIKETHIARPPNGMQLFSFPNGFNLFNFAAAALPAAAVPVVAAAPVVAPAAAPTGASAAAGNVVLPSVAGKKRSHRDVSK